MDTSQPLSDRDTAYRAQLADARVALEALEHPGHGRVEEYYQRIVDHYERLLHNTNLDPLIRQNICFAVEVARKFQAVRAHFESQLRHAEAELKRADTPALSPGEIGSRITSFMR